MPIKGADKHAARLKQMRQLTPVQMIRALYAGGQEIEIEAERSITEGSISGKGHIPSNPGEAPNADTRDLDTKIETEVVAENPPTVRVRAYSAHAAYLEYGTSRMAARPFMRPAAEKKRDRVTELVRDAMRITIK